MRRLAKGRVACDCDCRRRACACATANRRSAQHLRRSTDRNARCTDYAARLVCHGLDRLRGRFADDWHGDTRPRADAQRSLPLDPGLLAGARRVGFWRMRWSRPRSLTGPNRIQTKTPPPQAGHSGRARAPISIFRRHGETRFVEMNCCSSFPPAHRRRCAMRSRIRLQLTAVGDAEHFTLTGRRSSAGALMARVRCLTRCA